MRVAHINGNIRCFALALYFQFLNLKLYGKIHRAIYYQRVIFSWSLIFLLFIYLFTLSEIRPVSFLHINKVPRWEFGGHGLWSLGSSIWYWCEVLYHLEVLARGKQLSSWWSKRKQETETASQHSIQASVQ